MKRTEPENLGILCEQLHASGAVITFAFGVFDILHPGHIHFLQEALKLGTHLIVALYTDNAAHQVKGSGRPWIHLEDRMEVLAAMDVTGYVTWFDQMIPEELIRQIKPDILVNGTEGLVKLVQAAGGRAVNIPLLSRYSTTKIVEKIAKLPRV